MRYFSRKVGEIVCACVCCDCCKGKEEVEGEEVACSFPALELDRTEWVQAGDVAQ